MSDSVFAHSDLSKTRYDQEKGMIGRNTGAVVLLATTNRGSNFIELPKIYPPMLNHTPGLMGAK